VSAWRAETKTWRCWQISVATGAALVALILAFGRRSGAHFNPVVTVAFALRGEFAIRAIAPYVIAQCIGAVLGVLAAHAMFDLPLLQVSEKIRSSPGHWWSEIVAAFGLVFVILSCARDGYRVAAIAVGCYITAAYWFTASTSFANPAVTLARGLTATFAGIGIANVPAFALAQAVGAALAVLADRALRPS
jgi:glycerol uptake facilitator-like aquaporin